MVTALYSNQQGSKSQKKHCQVQPTENIRDLLVPGKYVVISDSCTEMKLMYTDSSINLDYGYSDTIP